MHLRPVISFIGQTDYEIALPYHPPEPYPELDLPAGATDPSNRIYAGVRDLLRAAGYDASHLDTSHWSPLSDLVRPGGTVVIKPNYVRHYHEGGGPFESVVTHLAVLRPLVDYAHKAVGDAGSVVIADAPQYDCDVDVLLERTGLPEFLRWYEHEVGRRVEWRDLRVQFGRHERGVVLERRELAGDPLGYEAVDLGSASEFAAMAAGNLRLLRGADYDEEVTLRHHSGGHNEYLVSKTVLQADLVINCPKVKTHKKAGVTLSMKNLIGINGDKNWLPHYRAGFTSGGGDEFPAADPYSRLRRVGGEIARRLLKRGILTGALRRMRAMEDAVGLGERTRSGNWYGNDTIWRTTLDLNKILYCGDERGRPGRVSRRVLNVYDGIVAGEGNGPMAPTPRALGLLAAGEDPGAVDVVLAWIMGFDWKLIPVLRQAVADLAGGLRITGFDGDAEKLPVLWLEGGRAREINFSEIDLNLRFDPHPGWRGRIEREPRGSAACAS
jgi:uncharacterized protein (DUF362 family)